MYIYVYIQIYIYIYTYIRALHVTKANMGSRGIAPLILNFGTGGRP